MLRIGLLNNVLDIKNLSVIFNTSEGRISAIRDLSLQVGQGEVFAVVGESGCGKSMLCKTIMGILPSNAEITGGMAKINGKEILGLSDNEMCKIRGADVSMVFQDPMTSLDPTYTIGAQIAEAILVHNKTITGDALKERVIELMDIVGIDRPKERYGSYPWMLSGGMRQRCVLAMALAQEPQLLLADEPTTALDVTVQAQILSLLKEIRDKTGMTVLFITHDMGVVARVADKVAIMYAGSIVEEGLCEEVFEKPVHPYTWALLHALPAYAENGRLYPIPGAPPVLKEDFKGDAFAPRNPYAIPRDFIEKPPFFEVSPTHKAATWLLEEGAPKVTFKVSSQKNSATEKREKSTKKLLEINNLTHYFRLGRDSYVKAISHVTFDIYKGEVLAIVGESGSGKSTLARCLLGIHDPLDGKALYEGIQITNSRLSRKEREKISREIQFISQDFGAALDPKMTVRDIIAEPLKIHRLYRNKSDRDEHIKDILKKVQLDEKILTRRPSELSGGQKQRVSIARAFVMNPRLLIADEPLSSLDVSIQAQIVEVLSALKNDRDTAMLFIAHDLSMVEFISDRVGVMYKGHLVELAGTKELFENPVHSYTKSLLAAAPKPDPVTEKARSIQKYKKLTSEFTHSDWVEVSDGHYVLMEDVR